MIKIVNNASNATKPFPDAPITGISRWPRSFFLNMTGEEILSEFCQSIDDFIEDKQTSLVAKYGWR